MQIEQALLGQAPLFALRATALGDGTTLLACTRAHLLMDGVCMLRLFIALCRAWPWACPCVDTTSQSTGIQSMTQSA